MKARWCSSSNWEVIASGPRLILRHRVEVHVLQCEFDFKIPSSKSGLCGVDTIVAWYIDKASSTRSMDSIGCITEIHERYGYLLHFYTGCVSAFWTNGDAPFERYGYFLLWYTRCGCGGWPGGSCHEEPEHLKESQVKVRNSWESIVPDVSRKISTGWKWKTCKINWESMESLIRQDASQVESGSEALCSVGFSCRTPTSKSTSLDHRG